MKLNKAISPILATVILIAVTLVIAIGVIGWIMGIWGSFGATETLQVYPDSFINATANTKILILHVKNTGSATAVIYRIEIVGLYTATSNFGFSTGFTTSTGTATEVSLTPGQEGYIVVAAGNPIPGTTYQVKIYTRAGNVFTANVQAK
ncbi:MAG: archaellin/type IV pilin N-terminal domain-containing protein [Zestosphaera sp.]